MPDVNILAVLVAAASSFLIGGLWYSPKLFGEIWNRAQRRHPPARRRDIPPRYSDSAFCSRSSRRSHTHC